MFETLHKAGLKDTAPIRLTFSWGNLQVDQNRGLSQVYFDISDKPTGFWSTGLEYQIFLRGIFSLGADTIVEFRGNLSGDVNNDTIMIKGHDVFMMGYAYTDGSYRYEPGLMDILRELQGDLK